MKNVSNKYFLLILVTIFFEIVFLIKTYAQENEIITVTPPAIIAIACTSKTDIKMSDENAVVFDDFSFHLSFAAQKLKPLGVNFYTIEKQKIFFEYLGKIDSIDLTKEDALVGYVFITPEGAVLKRYHVITNTEIIELAKKYFNLKYLNE